MFGRATTQSQLFEALAELVACKDIKDELDRLNEQNTACTDAQQAHYNGLKSNYEMRKKAAWERARHLLVSQDKATELRFDEPLMGGLTATEARDATSETRKKDQQFVMAMQRIAGSIRGAVSMKEASVNVRAYCDEPIHDVVIDELESRGFKVAKLVDRSRGDFRISW